MSDGECGRQSLLLFRFLSENPKGSGRDSTADIRRVGAKPGLSSDDIVQILKVEKIDYVLLAGYLKVRLLLGCVIMCRRVVVYLRIVQ